MKVTTVRFSEDLWATIQAEADLAGVSASQFIREAALARAAAAAGARRGVPLDGLPDNLFAEESTAEAPSTASAKTRETAGTLRSESEALRAESRQVRRAAAANRAQRVSTTRPI